MTKWKHKVDLGWLISRQLCLTATDIKDLLPVTKTGRKRTVSDEDYMKVYARKQVDLTEDDCVSYGAAARGHILEPYAINMWNERMPDKLYHWDDMVVTRLQFKKFGLGFSPDAMSCQMPNLNGTTMIAMDNVKYIGEIKSYSPEKHFVCGHTKPKDLDERWQLAVAMAVCESIEKAYLIFYNPSMSISMYIVEYTRKDLEDEIAMVLDVEQNWLTFIDEIGTKHVNQFTAGGLRESQIVDAIIKEEELNPEDEKTVIK